MGEKPTKAHYKVLFVVCVLYFICYFDRVNFAAAAPVISQEFGLTKVQLGAIFSLFSLSYFLFQVPVGVLGDRIGSRKILSIIVGFWAIFDFITGICWNFTSLLVTRFALGMGESSTFPNATRAFANWIPKTERGFAQGLTHGFSRFGGAVTPVITVAIITAFNWHVVFYVSGTIAATWALFWYFWYRNTPVEYRSKWGSVNDAELAVIDKERVVKKAGGKLPVKDLLRSRNVWALCISYFCYCYNIWIYLTWLPTYLVDGRGFLLVKMGFYASLPLIMGTLGDILGGWLSDKVWQYTGNGLFARRCVAITGMLMSIAFMIPAAITGSPLLAVLFLGCSLFGLEMSVGVYWAVCLDIGQEYAGAVSGLMGSVGNSGAFVSPLLFGVIVQTTGSWMYPFLAASGVLFIGVLLWLKINPELPVSEELRLSEQEEKRDQGITGMKPAEIE